MEYSVNGIAEPSGTFPTALFSIPRSAALLYLELRRVWPTMRAMRLARIRGVVVCLVSIKPVRSAVCAGGERTAFGLAKDEGCGRQSSSPPTSQVIFLITPRELPVDIAMP